MLENFTRDLLKEITFIDYSGLKDKSSVEKNDTKKEISNLLESGTDLRYIQELLGHSSSRTTEIYTHVSTKNIQQIKNPFDGRYKQIVCYPSRQHCK